ncbi:tRNA-uridine aminocarboxypropyltransferase [Pseudoalteromonas sp. T1lg48]|uniref:tRNA-uridine aminocarboxypropyltransferase n=1 Tax=Pseudoalteromonas sp. T1lg48 TaxID=2077100 RepID=UPI000CF6489C|nr:tRNA-uridine aminocarboxypropyltransferase [Pseudoalteromonas sp. T1lg48]
MTNSVLKLRTQQIAMAKREFKARGSKLSRCESCLLAQPLCICAGVEQVPCDVAVCMLMYHNESFKPSNTGRLIADIVPDNHAFRWDRTDPDPAFLALIKDPQYQAFVVFPSEGITPERVCTQVQRQGDKKPLFIFLDGTWREAKKMVRKSPYLDELPILSISPEKLSDYRLRVAPHAHQLGTAEVAIMVLLLAGETEAAEKLEQHFVAFRSAYLKGKRSKLSD